MLFDVLRVNTYKITGNGTTEHICTTKYNHCCINNVAEEERR